MLRSPQSRYRPARPVEPAGNLAGSQGGRWRLAIVPLLLVAAFVGWRMMATAKVGEWRTAPRTKPVIDSQAGANLMLPPMRGDNFNEPPVAGSETDDPAMQLVSWKARLDRFEDVLDNYRKNTRFPPQSRPAAQHSDQLYPNRSVMEDKRLYRPDDEALKSNIRLRTTQERIYVAGTESVLFTVTAYDGDDTVVPLSMASGGIVDLQSRGKPSIRQPMPVALNDAGAVGDTRAGDGTYSYRFSPATQGFANYTGALRLYLTVEAAGQPGYLEFNIDYTPEPPAIWAGALREVIESGSLHLYLKVNVRRPGRYIASGRLDDAAGKPFALAVFNEELPVGDHEILFRAFGKLVLDSQATMPLRLRDVEGYLVEEAGAALDRAMMPRLPGLVHLTKAYPSSVFSDAEWENERRDRYIERYLSEIERSRQKIADLEKQVGKPGKG